MEACFLETLPHLAVWGDVGFICAFPFQGGDGKWKLLIHPGLFLQAVYIMFNMGSKSSSLASRFHFKNLTAATKAQSCVNQFLANLRFFSFLTDPADIQKAVDENVFGVRFTKKTMQDLVVMDIEARDEYLTWATMNDKLCMDASAQEFLRSDEVTQAFSTIIGGRWGPKKKADASTREKVKSGLGELFTDKTWSSSIEWNINRKPLVDQKSHIARNKSMGTTCPPICSVLFSSLLSTIFLNLYMLVWNS